MLKLRGYKVVKVKDNDCRECAFNHSEKNKTLTVNEAICNSLIGECESFHVYKKNSKRKIK